MRSDLLYFGSSVLALASATTHRIDVGQDGLQYSPNSTIAAVGDVLEFHFYPKNHSVVQGDFSNPCESTTGFYSGFVPSMSDEAAKTFSVTVNDTKPIYFYCSQAAFGGHCANGMVGCVNCPTSGDTLEAYAQAAMMTTNASVTQPEMVGGGTFAGAADSSMSSPAATTAPSKTSMAATSSKAAMYTGAAQAKMADLGALSFGLGLAWLAV